MLTLDVRDPRPLHEKVAAVIRRAIAEGAYAPGSPLPPARDLAVALDVNTNTVLRALRRLREEGLLEFRRGRRVRVVGRAGDRAELLVAATELVTWAKTHGYDIDEVIDIIRSLY
ncbi:GntR family transcriptional regulator [Thermocatellispora tengchongensis]